MNTQGSNSIKDVSLEEAKRAYYTHTGRLASRAMEEKGKRGEFLCAAPVGYRNVRDAEGTHVELDPILAPLVLEAFQRAAYSGLPLRKLLAEMTAKGLVSRSGKPLQISGFWYMLKNPFYTGVVLWKGELIQGNHHPIVKGRLFEVVQDEILSRRRNGLSR